MISKIELPPKLIDDWSEIKNTKCNYIRSNEQIYFENCNVSDMIKITKQCIKSMNAPKQKINIKKSGAIYQIFDVCIDEYQKRFFNRETDEKTENKNIDKNVVLKYLKDINSNNDINACSLYLMGKEQFEATFDGKIQPPTASELYDILRQKLMLYMRNDIGLTLNSVKSIIFFYFNENNIDGTTFLGIGVEEFVDKLSPYFFTEDNDEKLNQIALQQLYEAIMVCRFECGAMKRVGLILNHFQALTQQVTPTHLSFIE